MLAKLAIGALVVATLALGRPVLLPIAFAAVMALILSGPMRWLERRVSKIPALALVMVLAASTLGGAGYVLVRQFDDLATQLGKYTESMRRKVAALQAGGTGPLARVEVMVTRVADGLEKKAAPEDAPVQVMPARVSRATHLWDLVSPLAEPLITGLFVLVLCVFMLGRRDDLRGRLIRLVGTGHLTAATRALDEGERRITRYLRDQTAINAIFGVVVGVGLYFIGVPYFVLWGAVAAVARFVPYLGAIASMLLPTALAFAIFPGWSRALLTVGLFVGMDLITAYAIEPVLIGYRTGVSSIALLVSAFFWAWIWGPVGLVLAIPMTLSLAVAGRHVPGLRFLTVLLGDDPPIGPELEYYQRLVARDEDGAARIARACQDELGRAGAMDRILIPALALAARDRGRMQITDDDQAFIVVGTRDIVGHLRPRGKDVRAATPGRCVGIAAHRADGEVLLEMLSGELGPEEGEMEVLPSTTTLDEVVSRVERTSPGVVCIGSFPPEGGPHARRLCGALKARFPTLAVIAFRPGEPGVDPSLAVERLREAGADVVVATLAEATTEMTRLLRR
ncbi:MAG: tqsA 1 [Anaeromyxobacteraceae bacterium]|nr:tqsA 1 [Anaeromyxobacteraceae bacterium]